MILRVVMANGHEMEFNCDSYTVGQQVVDTPDGEQERVDVITMVRGRYVSNITAPQSWEVGE
jgi:hypothetical protein